MITSDNIDNSPGAAVVTYQNIPLEQFSGVFESTTGKPLCLFCMSDVVLKTGDNAELSSVALGGKVIKVSDEFFAAAYHLLLVEVSV